MPRVKTFSDFNYSGEVKIYQIYDTYVFAKDKNNNRFIIYDKSCGDSKCTMRVSGKLIEMDYQGTPLVSDYKDYLYKLGIRYILFINEMEIVSKPINIRTYIIEKTTGKLMGPVAKLIRLLVYSDRSNSEELYMQLKDMAILQLFVISGYHFNLLFAILSKITNKFIKRKSIIVLLLLPYLYILDFAIPALRAFICLLLKNVSKEHLDDLLNDYDVIVIVAFICLLINPLNIYSYSFIMTFLINFNLILINKVFVKNIKIKDIIIPILTYVGFVPLMLNLNYELNMISILLNYLFSFILPFLYIGSLLVCIFNFLEVGFLAFILGFNEIAEWCSNINTTLIFGKPSFAFVFVYYCLYYVMLIAYQYNRKRTFIYSLSLLNALLIYKYYEPFLIDNASVTYINVNQGDSALISLPYNKGNILIDTGNAITTDYAKTRVIPYLKALGIKKLDYVVISHDDSDHCGGLDTLIREYDVENIIHGNQWEKYSVDEFDFYNLNRYDTSDDNDSSSVVYFTLMDKNFVFMGDASSTIEKRIMIEYPDLKIDIIKLGHHGSKTSSCYEFLAKYQPELAIISVGKNNSYGHPSSETLDNLYVLGIDYYRTDYDGTVVIEKIPLITQRLIKQNK